MRWLVLLEIKKSDFLNLSTLLLPDEFSLIAENGEYYLTSSHWESLTEAGDVYGKATKILQDISAVAMIHFRVFPLLKPDIIFQVNKEGKRQRFVALSAKIECDSSEFSIQLEGCQDITPNLEGVTWMKLAEEDETVKKVFKICTTFEHNWFNLYKIYEIIKKDTMIEPDVGINKKKRDKIEDWIPHKKIQLFTRTANIAIAFHS